MDNNISVEKWHEDERVWWDKYGDYMSYQWRLTPNLNKAIREKLEENYTSFLLNPGDKLLDLGCGSGWLSLYFSDLGMEVLGVDLSQGQINAANKLVSNRENGNLKFLCSDFIQWDSAEYKDRFDKVFVNAFLHHLPEIELESIFRKISEVLKSGGKVYMYEPLTSSSARPPLILRIVDALIRRLADGVVRIIPNWLNMHNDHYKVAREGGYVMKSPHERPIDIDLIKKFCANSFEIIEVKGWHLYSLGFAMQSMNLNDQIRKVYTRLTELLFWIDTTFFRIFGWKIFSRQQRFILCSIKLIKK